uniref:Uncharacterized protein n=1 Tax=Arundo donax TaxID=35708 RepID=A0A0A8YPI2_ARUDO
MSKSREKTYRLLVLFVTYEHVLYPYSECVTSMRVPLKWKLMLYTLTCPWSEIPIFFVDWLLWCMQVLF